MSIEDAWELYLGEGGRTTENRNRIVSLMYQPLIDRLTSSLNEKYVDAMSSEAGVVLMREVTTAVRQLTISDLSTLIRKTPLREMDLPRERVNLLKLAETGRIEADEFHVDREREEWKTGPDGAVDDPTIRHRPYSSSLIAAENDLETAGSESVLVREPSGGD